MAELLVSALLPHVIGGMGALGFSSATIVATAVAVTTGLSYLALAGGAYLLAQAFAPSVPEAPKPEDGKYNFRQSVPPLTYVLGRVKKGGDYVFLEERNGRVYHIIVMAAHRIQGFVEHWLHDERVTLDGSAVVSPGHFVLDGNTKVRIDTRLGNNNSTAYTPVTELFPQIWGADHRGDGLASVLLRIFPVPIEEFPKVFPHQMPQISSVIEGNDRLYDPRTSTAGYSENIALFRYWHLTHPVGGKLNRADMYDPDWAHAANVCGQLVTNRDGNNDSRYHGGFWFRANNDPVQVGRLMDQAAELVIYERSDGTVGVHAGEYVEPDVRLTAADIVSITYDPNKRKETNVLAVRGRYTDRGRGYNTADAAIYGHPYPSDDERTKTVDNQVVQRHNHMARLQKLAFIRANAPRVTIRAHFEPARDVPYRRFARVHYPPRLSEAVIEIIGRPTLSLANLTYEFEGIVVPPGLYAFDAATEEGKPGESVLPVERPDVPMPLNFDVVIQNEPISGSTAAFAEASFGFQNELYRYEIAWQRTAGGETVHRIGATGETSVRTDYLSDGVEYRFQARTWAGAVSSGWTSWQIRTAIADPVPPGLPGTVSATGGVGQVTFDWVAPNSPNYRGARVYLNTVNSFAGATLVGTEYGAPSAADSITVAGVDAGTYYGWVAAFNGSGISSDPAPTGLVTVT